jgi:hypothetical protein
MGRIFQYQNLGTGTVNRCPSTVNMSLSPQLLQLLLYILKREIYELFITKCLSRDHTTCSQAIFLRTEGCL